MKRTILTLLAGAVIGAVPAALVTNMVEDYRNPHPLNWVAGTPSATIPMPSSPSPVEAPTVDVLASPVSTAKLSDGKWTVGVDIQPATYKVDRPAPGNCYYTIYATGTNYTAILTSGYGGGQLVLTLKAGQDIELNDCGTWHKQ